MEFEYNFVLKVLVILNQGKSVRSKERKGEKTSTFCSTLLKGLKTINNYENLGKAKTRC